MTKSKGNCYYALEKKPYLVACSSWREYWKRKNTCSIVMYSEGMQLDVNSSKKSKYSTEVSTHRKVFSIQLHAFGIPSLFLRPFVL